MNDPQLHFLQYVRFYKMLNELPSSDRPSDDVLNDDERLDRWYDHYVRELAHRSGAPTPHTGRSTPTQMYEG